jgi:hypothetical protein
VTPLYISRFKVKNLTSSFPGRKGKTYQGDRPDLI